MAGALMRVHLLSMHITHQWLISRNEQGVSPSWIKRFFNFPCGQSSRKPHTIAYFLFLVVLHFLTSRRRHRLSCNHSLPLLSRYLPLFLLPFHFLFKRIRRHPRSVPLPDTLAPRALPYHRSTLRGTAHNWLGSSVVLGRVRLQVQIPRRALLYTIRSPANLKGPEPQYTASCANNLQSC